MMTVRSPTRQGNTGNGTWRGLMNHNLVALHEDLNMLGRFAGQDADARAARHRGQEAAIAHTGHHFGLAFTRPKKGFTSCFLGDKPPGCAIRRP